jgi:hypothetical protein
VLGAIAVALLTVSDNMVVVWTRTNFDKMPATLPPALFVTTMQALLNTPAGIFMGPKHVD